MIGLICWARFPSAVGRVTVPSPNEGKPYLADFLHQQAADLAQHFDLIQWPPISKAQGGDGSGCDGYGVFDRRDLGTKPQQGSVATRYGTLEMKLAAIAALRAHGCVSYGDLVMHQLMGENGGPGLFQYLGADIKTHNGRGKTSQGWFRGDGKDLPIPPFSHPDPVPDPANDFTFGRELVYRNCYPPGATLADAKDYVRWLTNRTGFVGYRFDDTKGTNQLAARLIMDAEPRIPFYSEYFDGNPTNLNWWATSPPLSGRSAVEDFTLHWRLQAACNGFDATQFDNDGAGYWQWRPDLSVGFVDNPDTDTSPGQQVVFNKGIAYALMLNLPLRIAMVYGRDYFGPDVWPGAYGLKPLIDNLCWIARKFAYGAFQRRWVDRDVYAYTRDGNGGTFGSSVGLLVAVNFNTWAARTVRLQTMWSNGTHLHDYTGHAGDLWVGPNGMVDVTVPPNAYSHGKSFVCYAPANMEHPTAGKQRQTVHVFEGADDLDVLPLANSLLVIPQRLYCLGSSSMTIVLQTLQPSNGAAKIEVIGPNGITEGVLTAKLANPITLVIQLSPNTGWRTIRLTGEMISELGEPFQLTATYTGATK